MRLKKIYKITIILIFLLSTIVCANNVEEEQIDLTQIKENVVQTASNATTIPEINSKSAIVVERTTRNNFIWQK